MAGSGSPAVPRQSVFDRLTDPNPRYLHPDEAERRIREAVRRDLEALLNSRRTPEPVPADLLQVRTSVYQYGLPDISSIAVHSKRDRYRLERTLLDTITAMEPRLRDVHVRLEDSEGAQSSGTRQTRSESSSGPQKLKFTIEATLEAPPCVQRVSFNTTLDLTSGECLVGG